MAAANTNADTLAQIVARVAEYLDAHQKRSADYPAATQPANRIHSVSAPGEDVEHTLTAADLAVVLDLAGVALADIEG